MTEASSAPYVANVIRPQLGRCFRYVYGGSGFGDYPGPCPEPVICQGVVLDPKGRRVEVEACAGHAPDLLERHPGELAADNRGKTLHE